MLRAAQGTGANPTRVTDHYIRRAKAEITPGTTAQRARIGCVGTAALACPERSRRGCPCGPVVSGRGCWFRFVILKERAFCATEGSLHSCPPPEASAGSDRLRASWAGHAGPQQLKPHSVWAFDRCDWKSHPSRLTMSSYGHPERNRRIPTHTMPSLRSEVRGPKSKV